MKAWVWAVVAGLLAASGAARADAAKAFFCVAVRTVPNLDQDNYVMGATGPIYMTANFTTELARDEVTAAWVGYIAAKHPVAYPNNPDDTCYPANTRREVMRAQHGDIRRVSVSWAPGKGGR